MCDGLAGGQACLALLKAVDRFATGLGAETVRPRAPDAGKLNANIVDVSITCRHLAVERTSTG